MHKIVRLAMLTKRNNIVKYTTNAYSWCASYVIVPILDDFYKYISLFEILISFHMAKFSLSHESFGNEYTPHPKSNRVIIRPSLIMLISKKNVYHCMINIVILIILYYHLLKFTLMRDCINVVLIISQW